MFSLDIVLNDLFLVVNDVKFESYADNNTFYGSRDSIDSVTTSLQISALRLFQWISDNQMKGNSNSCHFLTSTNETHQILVSKSLTGSCSCGKLRNKTDSKLTFDDDIKQICKRLTKR